MSPIYKGKNINFRVKVSELNSGFKHDMVFSFGFVLIKFSLILSLALIFKVWCFEVQFFSFLYTFLHFSLRFSLSQGFLFHICFVLLFFSLRFGFFQAFLFFFWTNGFFQVQIPLHTIVLLQVMISCMTWTKGLKCSFNVGWWHAMFKISSIYMKWNKVVGNQWTWPLMFGMCWPQLSPLHICSKTWQILLPLSFRNLHP
jgi:hypothetical protein